MADYDSVIVVNEGYEIRTSASGKERVTITVTSQPLIFNLDPKALGRGPAQAIAHHFRERIKGISEIAAPATLKARKVAAKAFAEGKAWAVKRYGGGRMGAMPPNQSDMALNDSGRLAASITANGSSDGMWRVNVAANRFDATTGNRERIMAKVRELVPEIENPALLFEQDIIRAAISKAQRDMVTRAEATTKNTSIDVAIALVEAAQALVDLIAV